MPEENKILEEIERLLAEILKLEKKLRELKFEK